MQVREKVETSGNTVFFQWFVAPAGRKVGSLKRRVRSHLARWEMKNCTPLCREANFQVKMYTAHHARRTFGSWDVEKCTSLWREAHFEVKMYKTHQVRTTFGSCAVEKVHAVVARSTFRSQNVEDTPTSEHFLEVAMSEKWTPLWQKHISKSKRTKHTNVGALLEVEMSKKSTPLWREAHVQVKSAKSWRVRSTFGGSDVVCAWPAQGIVHLVVSKTWGFSMVFQKRWRAWDIWRGSGKMDFPWQAQYNESNMLGGPGANFLRGVACRSIRSSVFGRWFVWQVQRFLRPGITFSLQAQYSRDMDWKNRKTHWYEAVSSAVDFPCLKEVFRRIASFLMLTSRIEEVSQNCFVFDVANFKNWGSLAELLRFQACR